MDSEVSIKCVWPGRSSSGYVDLSTWICVWSHRFCEMLAERPERHQVFKGIDLELDISEHCSQQTCDEHCFLLVRFNPWSRGFHLTSVRFAGLHLRMILFTRDRIFEGSILDRNLNSKYVPKKNQKNQKGTGNTISYAPLIKNP